METNSFPVLTGTFQAGITHEEFWFDGKEPARLPITIFYPAHVQGNAIKEKYAFKEAVFGLPISEMDTEFFKDAPVAGENEKYPVVIYNHGYGSYEMANSVLCGELAARGYIVVSLGHTKEATAVKFKDGTVVVMDEGLQAETHEPEKEAKLLGILQEIAAVSDCVIVGNVPFLFAGLAMTGFGLGTAIPLMTALMPDIVDYGEWKHGVSTPGILYSAVSLGSKAGNGLAVSLALLVLSIGGYDATLAVQPQSALTAITSAYIFVPLTCEILAFITMSFYRIDKMRDKIQEELAARRENA